MDFMELVDLVEHSHKFFSNRACKYFPCHPAPDRDNFNCLFCYCPLYASGENCGGGFKYSGAGVKLCIDCHLPHTPEYYDTIISKLKEARLKEARKGGAISN